MSGTSHASIPHFLHSFRRRLVQQATRFYFGKVFRQRPNFVGSDAAHNVITTNVLHVSLSHYSNQVGGRFDCLAMKVVDCKWQESVRSSETH